MNIVENDSNRSFERAGFCPGARTPGVGTGNASPFNTTTGVDTVTVARPPAEGPAKGKAAR